MTAAAAARRRDRLRGQLVELEIDVLLVTDPRNVRYLTGFTGSNGQVLVTRTGDDRVVTDERYVARAGAETDLAVVVSRRPVEVALASAAATARRVLGVEAGHLTWSVARGLLDAAEAVDVSVAPTDGLVEQLRQVKDAAELAAVAAACELTTSALAWVLETRLAPDVTERTIAIELERRFVDLGAQAPAFPTIVAAGPNGASPHHEPTGRPIARGELVTIDCGAKIDGYHADCTRTVAVGAPPSAQLTEIYEVVEAAQMAGRAAAQPGARAGDLDAAARTVITDAGFGPQFVHGTGHGVGLAVHELPRVEKNATATLAADTVLTIEPGVYVPGVGGVRIEDTVAIQTDGPARVLTAFPRSLCVVGE